MHDLDLDLEALFAGELVFPDDPEPEPFDPFTLLSTMHLSTAAANNCLAAFARYTSGEPLVRHHRAPMHGWSFLCPDPRCGVWQVEFKTTAAARTAWYVHCDERQHEFTASWPQDVPFDEPTQVICRPRGFGDNLLVDLIRRGVAVDNAGRLLTHARCEPCYSVENAGIMNHHLVISGMTCPGQMPCSKCGAAPGEKCDRSTPDLSPINFGRHNGFCGHYERFDAAQTEDFLREAAGDPRFPAPWRETIAPTARRTKMPTLGMKATLKVHAATETNRKWQQVVFRLRRTGRLSWVKPSEIARIVFPDVRSARKLADELVASCDVPAEDLLIEDSVVDWQAQELYSRVVEADARDLLRTFTHDTPVSHIAWIAGVISVRARYLRDNDPQVARIVQDKNTIGGFGSGYGYENTTRGFDAIRRRPGDEAKVSVTWSQVVKMIRGKIPAALLAEIRGALAEMDSFPPYSHEHERAEQWCTDVAMQAWVLVRPADLRPFDPMVPIDGHKSL